MKKLKKWIKGIIIFFVILLILLIAFIFSLGFIIKKGVESIGPMFTKTTISLHSCWFYPVRGAIEMDGFTLGNPVGFTTPYAFKFNKICIDAAPETLLNDVIIIESVTIDGVAILYDKPLKDQSNIERIIQNIEETTKALSGDDDSKTEKVIEESNVAESTHSKRVIIRKIVITNTKLEPGFMGITVPIPIPTITLNNVGGNPDDKDADGITIADAVKMILNKLLGSLSNISAESLKEAASLIKNIGDTSLNTFSQTGKAATESLKNIGKDPSGTLKNIKNGTSQSLKDAGETAKESIQKLSDDLKNIF